MNQPLFFTFHFYLFGVIAVASAITFITRKSPVAAALWLVNTMFSLAAMYIMLDAHFIGAIQIIVYAGAIMVVFLFVIMLLNLGQGQEITDVRGGMGKLIAGLMGLALLAQLLVIVRRRVLPADLVTVPTMPQPPVEQVGIFAGITDLLFTEQLIAFEYAAVLLLVAIVAAVVLAKRRA